MVRYGLDKQCCFSGGRSCLNNSHMVRFILDADRLFNIHRKFDG